MREGGNFRTAWVARGRLWLAASALAASALALSACSSKAGPSDDAMQAYLERHGLATAPTSTVDGTLGSDGEGAALLPVARRVALTVERAHGLPDLDVGPGETDPYVIVDYEGQRHRSSVVEGSLEPVWGDTFVIDVRPGGVLMVKLMDEDSLSSDEQIGTVSQVLPDLRVGESTTLTFTFRNGEGGTLELTLTGMVRP